MSQENLQVVDMEKFVLSSMLLKDGEIIPVVTSILTAEDFYRPEHKIIFGAILRIYSKKILPNILSLVEELKTSGELNKIGTELIFSLPQIANTTAYTEFYAQTVREKSLSAAHSGSRPRLIRWALRTIGLTSACRNTSCKRTTGIFPH